MCIYLGVTLICFNNSIFMKVVSTLTYAFNVRVFNIVYFSKMNYNSLKVYSPFTAPFSSVYS